MLQPDLRCVVSTVCTAQSVGDSCRQPIGQPAGKKVTPQNLAAPGKLLHTMCSQGLHHRGQGCHSTYNTYIHHLSSVGDLAPLKSKTKTKMRIITCRRSRLRKNYSSLGSTPTQFNHHSAAQIVENQIMSSRRTQARTHGGGAILDSGSGSAYR